MSSGLAYCLLALPVSPWLLTFSLGREQDGHRPGPAPQARGVREYARGYTRQGGGVPGRVHSIPKPGSPPRQPLCLGILSSSHNFPESGGVGLFWSVQGTLRDEPQNTNCVISVIPHMHQML